MTESYKNKKYHYVYEITNIYSGMRYIGARSSKNPPHLDTNYMGSSRHLKKAIKEEGLDHFVKIILQEFSTRKEALEQEIFLHNKFNVNKDPNFYNKAKQTSTGFDFQAYGPDNHMYGKHPKGRKLTKEEIEKLRQINIGHEVKSETRQKIGKANRGKRRSEEVKKRMSKKRRKRIYAEESRQGMKKSQSGEKSPGYGKTLSQDHKNKIKEKAQQELRYIYMTPVGEFLSAAEAGKALQCSKDAIIHRCKDEFEGYSRKLLENPYTEKRERLKELVEQGFGSSEIAKKLGVTRETIWVWKKKFGLIPSCSPTDPSWQKNYCL